MENLPNGKRKRPLMGRTRAYLGRLIGKDAHFMEDTFLVPGLSHRLTPAAYEQTLEDLAEVDRRFGVAAQRIEEASQTVIDRLEQKEE